MKKTTKLLLIDEILDIFLEDNILNIKLLGGCFTEEIIKQFYSIVEVFYDICKKKNKKFYTIYDFVNCKLIYVPNYLYYLNDITSFLKKHSEFYATHLYSTLIITNLDLTKNLCNSILSQYTPTRPFKFITKDEEQNFDFE